MYAIIATPVTNQMEHTASLTWLYWLLLPAFFVVVGIAALWRRGKEHHEARRPLTPLEVEQARLVEWRKIAATGVSPAPGLTPQEAIELQEHRCRQLFQLQSGVQPGTPGGGRTNNQQGR